MRKLTNEEFLARVKSIHGDEYTPLEEYKGARTKIRVKHNKCGEVYLTTPDNLYNGGCLTCGYEKMKKKQRKTQEEFDAEVYDLVGDEYTFLDKYVNNTTKLLVRHNKCGHKYYVTPRDFLSGRRCPKERNERIRKGVTKSHEYFLQRLGDSLGSEYELLSKYKNARTKMKLRHKKCGLVFEMTPPHILEGKRCPECWKEENGLRFRKTHEQFLEEITPMWNSEYELLSKYEKQTVKVKVLHKKCGRVFSAVPDSLLRGSGCPYCKESHGEKKISSWLLSNDVQLIPQYTFEDCVFVEKLRFDFAIIIDDSVSYLIEYHGIQHFEPVEFFGGEEAFYIQQMRDEIKRNFAKERGIPLIEISYKDDIESVLSKSIPR